MKTKRVDLSEENMTALTDEDELRGKVIEDTQWVETGRLRLYLEGAYFYDVVFRPEERNS